MVQTLAALCKTAGALLELAHWKFGRMQGEERGCCDDMSTNEVRVYVFCRFFLKTGEILNSLFE